MFETVYSLSYFPCRLDISRTHTHTPMYREREREREHEGQEALRKSEETVQRKTKGKWRPHRKRST